MEDVFEELEELCELLYTDPEVWDEFRTEIL